MRLPNPDEFIADLEALKSGILASKILNVRRLKIFTNSNILISIMTRSTTSSLTDIYTMELIIEIKHIIREFEAIELEYVFYTSHFNDLMSMITDSTEMFSSLNNSKSSSN